MCSASIEPETFPVGALESAATSDWSRLLVPWRLDTELCRLLMVALLVSVWAVVASAKYTTAAPRMRTRTTRTTVIFRLPEETPCSGFVSTLIHLASSFCPGAAEGHL